MSQTNINRLYGSAPKTGLAKKVLQAEQEIDKRQQNEVDKLYDTADRRRFNELSDKPLSQLSWDECNDLNDLKKEYTTTDIKKDGGMEEGNAADMTDSSLDPNTRMHGKVLQSIEELQDLASQHNMDISEEIKMIKVNLKTLMDVINKNPEKVVSKGIKKGLLNYDTIKHAESQLKKSMKLKKSCPGPACELQITDGLQGVPDAVPGSVLKIYKNGHWSIE